MTPDRPAIVAEWAGWDASDGFGPREYEILQAGTLRKVGRTAVARLVWFARFATQAEIPTAEKRLKQLDNETFAFMYREKAKRIRLPCCDLESLVRLRDESLELLNVVVNGGEWELDYDDLRRRVRQGSISGYIGPRHKVFMAVAGELVGVEGKRLKRCARAGCERIFVQRKRGKYCGRACSAKEQTRKFRERYRKMKKHWEGPNHARPARKTNALPKENA